MQKETRRNSAAGSTKPNPPRKLTRAEKKQIAEIIRQAKGDGKAHTAQQTIPYIQMYPDGICKVTERKYSKTVAFEDINYQLAQADDKTAIFENWCDFLNYFDASVSVQLSFINQGTQRGEAEKAVNIPAQDDAFNSIRSEYGDMLQNQLAKGNNGLVKAKYITFAIEADSLGAAKSRLARIETDVLNNFKLLGVSARPMTGYERLKMLHGIFHPEGGQFAFDFSWLAPSGLSTKDFTKSKKYFYDAAAIAEPLAPTTAARYRTGRSAGQKYADEVPGQGNVQGLNRARSGSYYDEALMPTMRNRRDVWLINTVPYKGGHFAAFPPKLAETCIKAGCPKGGVVLDPFFGSGTTGAAAKQLDRHYSFITPLVGFVTQ